LSRLSPAALGDRLLLGVSGRRALVVVSDVTVGYAGLTVPLFSRCEMSIERPRSERRSALGAAWAIGHNRLIGERQDLLWLSLDDDHRQAPAAEFAQGSEQFVDNDRPIPRSARHATEGVIRPFTTVARPCRKDWLFVPKEALVSWQTARRVRVTQPPHRQCPIRGSSW
jgi:hypothetical protein